MVLVLQRRVLVMGPRIILRSAILIDSNIGGSGHRPLLREARARSVSCGCFLFEWFLVRCLCVCCLVGLLFLLALLSRLFGVLAVCLEAVWLLSGTTAGGERYYRS